MNTFKAIIFSQCSGISLPIKQVGYYLSLLKGSSILKSYTFTWLYKKKIWMGMGGEWDFRRQERMLPQGRDKT